jgi:tellurite resistance protein TerC
VFLQQGLAIILAFVGVKMLIHSWYHIPTWLSLTVIAIVLIASIGFSLQVERTKRDAELAGHARDDESDPVP